MGTSDQYKVFDSILDWSPTLSIVLGPPGVPISLKSVFLETPCSLSVWEHIQVVSFPMKCWKLIGRWVSGKIRIFQANWVIEQNLWEVDRGADPLSVYLIFLIIFWRDLYKKLCGDAMIWMERFSLQGEFSINLEYEKVSSYRFRIWKGQ